MKTYLVTGGAGFIGSNFVLHLLMHHDDIRVVNVDKLTYAGNLENLVSAEGDARHIFVRADICDADAMCEAFERWQPDYVVNFAAESHVDRSIADPGVFANTNVQGTVTLLNTARAAWEHDDGSYELGKRFLQVSTDEVYGSLSLDEPDVFFTEETPLAPHSPYSASKASADLFVKAYGDTYGMPVNITRCSNNYGPRQFPEKLIPLMISNALRHKELPVYGDGLNVRDWLYVEDHCKAIDLVVREGRDGQVYNVGGHNEMKNIDIVKLTIKTIHDMMENEPELRKVLKKQEIDKNGNIRIDWINDDLITFVADRLGHDQRYAIDPTKIKNELGWYPETKFADGIVKTIRWNLEHQDWIKDVTSGDYQKYYEQMYGNR